MRYNRYENLEPGSHGVAQEAGADECCTAGLLLHASEALSAVRSADALERIADTLEELRTAILAVKEIVRFEVEDALEREKLQERKDRRSASRLAVDALGEGAGAPNE